MHLRKRIGEFLSKIFSEGKSSKSSLLAGLPQCGKMWGGCFKAGGGIGFIGVAVDRRNMSPR
jgi:hypothetical protein